jgi:hypothetical protein
MKKLLRTTSWLHVYGIFLSKIPVPLVCGLPTNPVVALEYALIASLQPPWNEEKFKTSRHAWAHPEPVAVQ